MICMLTLFTENKQKAIFPNPKLIQGFQLWYKSRYNLTRFVRDFLIIYMILLINDTYAYRVWWSRAHCRSTYGVREEKSVCYQIQFLLYI